MSTKQEYSVQIFNNTGMMIYFFTVRSGLAGKRLASSIISTTRRRIAREIKNGNAWMVSDADRIVVIMKGPKVKGTPFDARRNLTQVIQIANVKY